MEIQKNTFVPVHKEKRDMEEISQKSISFLQDFWRRFKQDPLAIIGLSIVCIIVLAVLLTPFITTYDPNIQNFDIANNLPNRNNIFGTDAYGRDLFTRVLYGARISMTVAFSSVLISLFIGVIYGGVSGFIGGKVDVVMMRIVEVLSGVPQLLYLILFMVKFGPGIKTIVLSMSISGWLGMGRMVRSQALSIKEQEFVTAVRTLGVSEFNIFFKHILPNSMGVIIVNLTFAIPGAIFQEAFLSFLGLGVSAPQASWGVLANQALETYRHYFYQLLFPSLAICITILAFNFLGDGLRDALDPKMRK